MSRYFSDYAAVKLVTRSEVPITIGTNSNTSHRVSAIELPCRDIHVSSTATHLVTICGSHVRLSPQVQYYKATPTMHLGIVKHISAQWWLSGE